MLSTTVVIINYNSGIELLNAVNSVIASDTPAHIVVVDNASADDSLQQMLMRHQDGVQVIRNTKNMGFGPACNQAIAACETDYVLILNADCTLPVTAITCFEAAMTRYPRAGLVAGIVSDSHGEEQSGSRRLLPNTRRVLYTMLGNQQRGIDLRHQPLPEAAVEVEAVSGACMFIRRCAFNAIHGFDTRYTFHFEDLDLMCRLQLKGWKVLLLPEVVVSHIGAVSSMTRPLWVSWHKHQGLLRYLRQHDVFTPSLVIVHILTWVHFIVLSPCLFLRRCKP